MFMSFIIFGLGYPVELVIDKWSSIFPLLHFHQGWALDSFAMGTLFVYMFVLFFEDIEAK